MATSSGVWISAMKIATANAAVAMGRVREETPPDERPLVIEALAPVFRHACLGVAGWNPPVSLVSPRIQPSRHRMAQALAQRYGGLRTCDGGLTRSLPCWGGPHGLVIDRSRICGCRSIFPSGN